MNKHILKAPLRKCLTLSERGFLDLKELVEPEEPNPERVCTMYR
jgi:hypothetical protein